MIDGYLLSLRLCIAGWVFLGVWTGLHTAGIAPALPGALSSYTYAALGTITLIAFIGKLASDFVRRRGEASDATVEAFRQGWDLRAEHCTRSCQPKPDAKILHLPVPNQRESARPAVGQTWVDPNDGNIPTVILPPIRDLGTFRRPSPFRPTRR